LGNTDTCLFLPFVAVFRKLRKKQASVAASIFQPPFDGETVRLPTLFDDAVVSRKDIGSIGGYDLVDLQGNGIPECESFQPLAPMLRLDLALRVDFGNVARGSNSSIDRGFALFVEFGFLAEENHGESGMSAHGCKGLMIKRMQHRDIAAQGNEKQCNTDNSRPVFSPSPIGHELVPDNLLSNALFRRLRKIK